MTDKLSAERAIVLWNDAAAGITELMVCDIGAQTRETRRLRGSRGACCSGWMSGGIETPMGLFLELAVAYGFASPAVKIAALREFAKIAGEEWPVILLRRLHVDIEEHGEC